MVAELHLFYFSALSVFMYPSVSLPDTLFYLRIFVRIAGRMDIRHSPYA
jgi:hypothetical protein